MIRHIITFAICAALTACSSDGKSERLDMIKKLTNDLITRDEKQKTVDPRKVITRAQLDKVKTPLILAEIPQREQVGTLALYSRDTRGQTWLGQDGATITTRNGTLIATRGMGPDLMAADWVTNYQNDNIYSRRWESLRSDNEIITVTMNCSLVKIGAKTVKIFEKDYKTVQINEKCTNDDLEIVNTFWIEDSGLVRKSKQWHGQDIGFILLERMN